MTPFSAFLNGICRSRGMLQKQVAYMTGVDPSYLSAMARGKKSPTSSFVQRLEKELNLDQQECQALSEAVQFSQRLYRIPSEANESEHEMVWQIMSLIGKLRPAQISAINAILKL
ncbi:XRE family transcriptional regulator [Herminiimonas sp. KBW02]|uniref:helix-turn-helix domain-containing protein n=1 Tax=Herminiimonas sp. KBW02 TaxID=2153363 RepID=UPI000F5B40BA|nr:helix-turn-helix transcriptional regulator [Herminiimonas sp. KBW02]RQO37218.1 XRE family transcriptional regulator [Herminiimonas sp. KBW02]